MYMYHLEGPNRRSKESQRCGDILLTPGQHEIHESRDIMEHEKDETAQVESLHRATREGVEIDHAAEKKLVRKLDLNIIPIVMLLYLFSFLDRQVFYCFQPDETWLEKANDQKSQYRQCQIVWDGRRFGACAKSVPDSRISSFCDLSSV